MERKVSTGKYAIALILTIIVFTSGVLVGILTEDARIQASEDLIFEQKVDLRSLQLQQDFVEYGASSCEALDQIMEANIETLSEAMGTIMNYKKKAFVDQDDFDLAMRDYFLTEIQFNLLTNEIQELCDTNTITILYFYDDSPEDNYGSMLDYIKKTFGSDVLIFSFDSSFNEEPMISVMQTEYGVERYPSMIINDELYDEAMTLEELEEIICSKISSDQCPQ